jgi:MoaA/NifB/PqqE/SkfB family radical SAM enzyme
MNQPYKRLDIKTGFICNNNCRFCVQADNKCRGNRTFEEIKKDLIESKQRCSGVVLTGGEVTIRSDFFEIVKLAKELGYETIQIQTNGRMFSSLDFCKKVVEAGANEFSPALHGYCAEQHDFLTNAPGSFNQTVKGIKNLKSLNQRIITNTVISKSNYATLPKIAHLLVKLDVNQFQFAFVHPMGNAQKNFNNIVPNMNLVKPYLHRALQIGLDAGKKAMAEAMPYCFMQGYEQCISENIMPETEIKGKKFQNTDSFSKQRKKDGKAKFSQCKICKYDYVCEGPWKEYSEKKGEKEFIPIEKEDAIKEKKLLNWLFYKDYYNFLSLITVLGNQREIGRLVVSKKKADIIISYLKKTKIYYEAVPRAKTSDAFAFEGGKNKYNCSDADLEFNKENNIYLYISKDANLIEKLKNSEIKGDPNETGRLLGYPKCCVKKHFIEINKGEISDISIINSLIKGNEERNHFLFYNNCNASGKTLISHFPCSYDCQESTQIAKENLKLIESINKKFANHLIFYLTRPAFISEKFIVHFHSNNPEFGKTYSNEEFVISGIKTETIKLIDNKTIQIGNDSINGKLVFFNQNGN